MKSMQVLKSDSRLKTADENKGQNSNHISTQQSGLNNWQRNLGNQVMQRLYATGAIRTKLIINQPGDEYEQEADQVANILADHLDSIPDGEQSQTPLPIRISRLQHSTVSDDEKNNAFQVDDAGLLERIESPGEGRPLPIDLRQNMETAMGDDFSSVRIHDSARNQADADRLNAKAFTYKNNIWLGYGESTNDHTMMAHELTHVVQQNSNSYNQIHAGHVEKSRGNGSRIQRQVALEPSLVSQEKDQRVVDDKKETMETPEIPEMQDEIVNETKELEPDEEKKLRWKDYTVVGKKAYIWDQTDGKELNLRKIYKINNDYAYLCDPDNLGKYLVLSDAEQTTIPAGTKIIRRKSGQSLIAIPRNTQVNILGKPVKEKGIAYVNVQWNNDQLGWIKAGNTSDTTVKIPIGTKVEIGGDKIQNIGKQKFIEIEWEGQKGWTLYENVGIQTWDLTYATRFSEERTGIEIQSPKDKRLQFEEIASNISAKEVYERGQIIGHIARTDAGIRDENDNLTKENLRPGVYLILHQAEKSVHENKGKTRTVKLAQVVRLDDFQAHEAWTRFTNLIRYQHEEGFSIEEVDNNLALVMRTKPPKTRGEEPKIDRYKIAPPVAEKLNGIFLEKVEQTVTSKKFTKAQEVLLAYAKAFATNTIYDETNYAKPKNLTPLENIKELQIPVSAIAQDGECLNADLIERMRRFYKFISHANLITSSPVQIVGIRTRATAHELSTKWTLNPNSDHLKKREQRIEFARRLVSLGDQPDAANINWLLPEQIATLADCLEIIDNPVNFRFNRLYSLLQEYTADEIILMTPTSMSLFSPASRGSSNEESQDASKSIGAVYSLLDSLILYCQRSVTLVGNRNIQKAQAAEGFPLDEVWGKRRPNTNDKVGISNHCGGEAIDVTFPFVFNYYDPIIDAVAMYFGLSRPVKDSKGSPEHWHYERIGINYDTRPEIETTILP